MEFSKFNDSRLEQDLKKLEEEKGVLDLGNGEKIVVTSWQIYPSYQFIFGVPDPESERAKREVAVMVVKYKDGRGYFTYFDKTELKDSIESLVKIYEKIGSEESISGKR